MDKYKKIAKILQGISDSHHQAFAETNGVDTDWAIWYAGELLKNAEVIGSRNVHPTRSKLIYALMALGNEFTSSDQKEKGSWNDFYAQNIDKYLDKKFSN